MANGKSPYPKELKNLRSVDTGALFTDRLPDYQIRSDSSGTFHAEGRNDRLGSGTFDDVLQDVIDAAGIGTRVEIVDPGTLKSTKEINPNGKRMVFAGPTESDVINVDVGAGNDAFVIRSDKDLLPNTVTFRDIALDFTTGRHGWFVDADNHNISRPKWYNCRTTGGSGDGLRVVGTSFEGVVRSFYANDMGGAPVSFERGPTNNEVPEMWWIDDVHGLSCDSPVFFNLQNAAVGNVHTSNMTNKGVEVRGRRLWFGHIYNEKAGDIGVYVPAAGERVYGWVRDWDSTGQGIRIEAGTNRIGYAQATNNSIVTAGGENYIGGYDANAVNFGATTQVAMTPTVEKTVTVASGTTTTETLSTSVGGVYEVDVAPANDPGNDHGYTVDKVVNDTSAGEVQAQITETEGAGGGDARIVARRVA